MIKYQNLKVEGCYSSWRKNNKYIYWHQVINTQRFRKIKYDKK
jgi:hypothetical protein